MMLVGLPRAQPFLPGAIGGCKRTPKLSRNGPFRSDPIRSDPSPFLVSRCNMHARTHARREGKTTTTAPPAPAKLHFSWCCLRPDLPLHWMCIFFLLRRCRADDNIHGQPESEAVLKGRVCGPWRAACTPPPPPPPPPPLCKHASRASQRARDKTPPSLPLRCVQEWSREKLPSLMSPSVALRPLWMGEGCRICRCECVRMNEDPPPISLICPPAHHISPSAHSVWLCGCGGVCARSARRITHTHACTRAAAAAASIDLTNE